MDFHASTFFEYDLARSALRVFIVIYLSEQRCRRLLGSGLMYWQLLNST